MGEAYEKWYEEFKDSMHEFDEDALFGSLDELLHRSRNTFSLNRKLMKKAIDVSWVEAIENGLLHIDNVLRSPRRTIEDVEEIVPIALSRKITIESVKHLAQHTDLIQSYDSRTGKITPSKILNINKEESLMTYENKFVNTLIDRLYIFINTRYEKLAQVAKDEEVFSLGYDTSIDDGSGGKMRIEVKIESTDSLDEYNASGMTIWQRVEKVKKIIEGYKGSELCKKLGNSYIRPPVMRTNAILKNVDLKACLTLWQYIEGYDRVGYEINIEDTAVKPEGEFVEDFYRLVMLHMLLFRSSICGGKEELTDLKAHKSKRLKPKFVRRFDNELSGDYGVTVSAAAGYVAQEGELKIIPALPTDVKLVFNEIDEVIRIEKNFLEEYGRKQLDKRIAAEQEKLRKQEEERIEAAKQAERERLEKEREEEEKRIQEMLAKKRAEQEAEQRERERIEQERLIMLEEKRKREEEERLRREEEERLQAERERVIENKQKVRSELGEAEGISEDELVEKTDDIQEVYYDITKEEIEEAAAAAIEENMEFEDPREVAAKMKIEQQRREKERAETERAERLKAKRQYFENKPFMEIYREYSKNPIYAVPRFIKYLLFVIFGIVPKNTDNPDHLTRLAVLEEKKRIAQQEKEERDKMEVYYRKYARTFKYRFMRSIEDRKFKKKRAAALKGKPRPVYVPPKRTAEEEKAILQEMQRLYKEYHVTVFERARRGIEKFRWEHRRGA